MNFLYKIYETKIRLCVSLILLLVVANIQAQVTVDVRIDSLELWVGEQTRITLEVSADSKSMLEFPVLTSGDTLISGVEVVDVLQPDTQFLNEGNRCLISQAYMVTSFDSAFYYLPPFKVKVDNEEYHSKSLALRVLSLPVDTVHVDQFYGPKALMDVPFSWDDWSPVFGFSLLLLLWGILLSYLYIRFRDNKPVIKTFRSVPKILPHAEAMQEIDLIKAEKAWAKEDSKEYYTRLTSILRTYIEKRYGFNAMEMTSTEIIEHLLKEQTQESLSELRSLFQTADLVKFAKYNTLINENDANLMNAIEFINQTKVEVDPTIKPEQDEIVLEKKRSRRVIRSMCITLIALTMIGVALLGWIIWLIYGLMA